MKDIETQHRVGFPLQGEEIGVALRALDLHAIVSIADARGNITYVNDKFVEISGYSRDELLGCNHNVLKSGHHGPNFFGSMWKTISKGEVWSGEILNRRKDGSHFWVKSTIQPVLDARGKPKKFVAVRTDVTDVKVTEAQSQLARSFNRTDNRVFVFCAESLELVFLNENALSDYGLIAREIEGLRLPDLIQRKRVFQDIFDETAFRQLSRPLITGARSRVVYETVDSGGQPVELRLELVVPENEGPRFVAVFRDISEMKRVESENQRFKAAVESIHNEIYMFRADTLRFSYVNREAAEKTGWAREELLKMTPVDLKPGFDEDSFRQMIAPLVAGKEKSITFETFHIQKDGGLNPVEIFLQYFDDKGRDPYFVAIAKDISERNRLKQEVLQLKHSLDLGRNEIYMFWPDSLTFIYLNRVAMEVNGVSEDDYRGHSIFDVLPETATRDLQEKIGALLDGREKVMVWETYSRKRNASVEITLQLIQPQGQKPRLYAVYRDITERKEAEREIRQLKKALDLMKSEIYMYTPDRLSFLYLNQTAMQRFGWSESEYLKKSVADISEVFDPQRYRRHIQPLLDGSRDTLSYETVDENGRPVEITEQYIRSERDGGRIVSILRDISERKEVDRRKSEFISTVSHELRTPLTSITGALGLITSGAVGEVPEVMAHTLDLAHKNSGRLAQLINDILDLEKIESRKVEFHRDVFDASTLVNESIENNLGYAEKFGVRFVATGTDRPIAAIGDQMRLMRVMDNLLSNAAKFSGQGKDVDVSLTQAEGRVVFAVRDHGIGIPREAQDRVFEKFTQVDSTDTRQYGGTGLGLNIARSIVRKLNGDVWFTSELGKGTTFYFDLPAGSAEDLA